MFDAETNMTNENDLNKKKITETDIFVEVSFMDWSHLHDMISILIYSFPRVRLCVSTNSRKYYLLQEDNYIAAD